MSRQEANTIISGDIDNKAKIFEMKFLQRNYIQFAIKISLMFWKSLLLCDKSKTLRFAIVALQ